MKTLLLITTFLLFSFISFAQVKSEKQYNTTFNVGYSFNNNISISVGGRFYKSIYLDLDHYINTYRGLQSNYIGIGVGNKKNIIKLKLGVTTKPMGNTHINYTDYGIEYDWFYDNKYTYGLAITNLNGIQFKLGFVL
jgi:hypothetical protein